jgi:hypothetical protein
MQLHPYLSINYDEMVTTRPDLDTYMV